MRTLAEKKKLREEGRKKRIIRRRRNRVKTICSQTSFGEHNKRGIPNDFLDFNCIAKL